MIIQEEKIEISTVEASNLEKVNDIYREKINKLSLNLLKKEFERVSKYLGINLSAFLRMSGIEKASKIDTSQEKKQNENI